MPRVDGDDEAGYTPREILKEGTVVLAFISPDDSESRVIAGAPRDWRERPEALPELFAKAGVKR
jgi:hypothetical protein